MTSFFDIALTQSVLDLQEQKGSLGMYGTEVGPGRGEPHELSDDEAQMLQTRDSFYLASVSETGWPYVQHRGGEAGFVRVIDSHTIGWVERNGNRQYVGTGNITSDGRVAAIFMDYPSRTRLKMYGIATHHADPSPELLKALGAEDIRHDGAVTIDVVATNWNCPKYITPRYTNAQVEGAVSVLHDRIADLEEQLAAIGR